MRLQKLIPNSLYFLLGFGLLINGQSSIAGLKDQFSSKEADLLKCTTKNAQFIRKGWSNNFLGVCVIDNEIYLEDYGKRAVLDKTRRIEGNQHTGYKSSLEEFTIEGNEMVMYTCTGLTGAGKCSGTLERNIFATKK